MATESGSEHFDAQEHSVVSPYDISISPTRSGSFFPSLGKKKGKATQSRTEFLRQNPLLVDNSRKVLSLSTRDVEKNCAHRPLGSQKHLENSSEGHDNAEPTASSTLPLQADAADTPPTPTPTAPSPAATTTPAHALELGGPTLKGMRSFNQTIDDTVRERFRCVHEKLEPALLELLHKKRVDFRPLSLEILVLGHRQDDAKPWIVVRCSKAAKRRIKSFLREDFVKNLCQGPPSCHINFDIIVAEAIVKVDSDELHEAFIKLEPAELFEAWTPQIRVFHSGEVHYATMGGFVRVVDNFGEEKLYGLTAGHVLPADDPLGEEWYEEDILMMPPDDEDEEDNLDDSDDEENDKAIPSANNFRERSMDSERIESSEQALVSEPEEHGSSGITDSISWVSLGPMSKASYLPRARNRDWALIEVNGIHKQLTHPVAKSSTLLRAVPPTDDRHAITRNMSGFECVVRSLPARAILPSGHRFVDVLVVQPDQKAVLPAGSSGTWIIDFEQNKIVTRVYGALIATDTLQNLWMVPMTDILNDIKDEFNAAEVGLVTGAENTAVEKVGINHGYRVVDRPPRVSRSDQGTTTAHGVHAAASRSTHPNKRGLPTPFDGQNTKRGKEPDFVWHCSDCGDGPYGPWQNVCMSCDHIRCSFCGKEKV